MSNTPDSKRPRPLFSAKTTRPQLPGIVYRERCSDLLNEARDSQILYISGPAGQGKSTLVLSWLKRARKRVVYLRLDEHDNLPETIFPVLAEAFAVGFPQTDLALPPIPATVPYDAITFARTYFQHLLSQATGRYTLVLDDFHSIKEQDPGSSIFKTLIETLKPDVQVVIISRTMAPAFLSPWLSRRQLYSLDPVVLRFSIDEISALYKEVWGRTILHAEAETLHRITEGWVTGLILLQNRTFDKTASDAHLNDIDSTFTDNLIADYFYHEVYRILDPELQTFMVRSALFESFSIPLITALTSRDTPCEVEERVRFLIRNHLLTEIPAAGELQFRYHLLLRDFLSNRMQDFPAEVRREWVDQTASALQQEGKWNHAVDLCLSHRHFDTAIALIEQFGMIYISQGKRQRLLQWVQAIPEKQVSEHPWLQFFLGAGREFQQPDAALNDYQVALDSFQRAGNVEGELWTLSSLISLHFGLGQDLRMMKTYAVQGKSLLNKYKSTCSPAVLAVFLFADGLTACYAETVHPRALNCYLKSAKLAQQNGIYSLYITAISFAGILSAFSGESPGARILFNKAEQAIAQTNADLFLRAQLLWLRGNMEIFHGNYEACISVLSEAEKICLDYGFITFLDPVQSHLARARLALGHAEAWASLESIQQRIAHSPNRWHEGYIFYIKALHFLQTGDLSSALSHAEESIRLLNECGGLLSLAFATALAGVILRERGELRKAETYLLSALSDMEKGQQTFFCFGNLLHLSQLSIECNKEDQAKQYLTRALRMGKKESLKAAEGLTYPTQCNLVQHAIKWNLDPEYVSLLQAHWNVPSMLPMRIDTLGCFEVYVDGRAISREAWRGRKTRELLLILLSLGGKDVSKERISDLLWPDATGDKAITSFHTTLHRLQQVLIEALNGNRETLLIRLESGMLSLNDDNCTSDCSEFEDIVRRCRQCEISGEAVELQRCLQKAQALYQGEYLPGIEEPWAEHRRQSLHQKWNWVKDQLNKYGESSSIG
jgi:LuxR family maltose regulon positive regulatory protein